LCFSGPDKGLQQVEAGGGELYSTAGIKEDGELITNVETETCYIQLTYVHLEYGEVFKTQNLLP
jgi:hypothetical protein